MSISENEYRNCDQCMRECPVDHLRCENGARRYKEITGEEYPHAVNPVENAGASRYRETIRKRRAAARNKDRAGQSGRPE